MMNRASMLKELDRTLASGPRIRSAETLNRVTDLFVASASRYTEEQVELFDEVMGRLVTVIELRARAVLATRLAPISNAPGKVIRLLAFDDAIEVAGPVLTKSERLDDGDLIANASCKSQLHLLAISNRKALSESLTDVLIARGDRDVIHSVVRNMGARISDGGFGILVERSHKDDDLAIDVGARRDLPRRHFLRLLERASAVVRIRLAAQIPSASSALDTVLTEVVDDIRGETREASPFYLDAHDEIEALIKSSNLTEDDVHRFARERRFEQTAVAMSRLCNVALNVIEGALHEGGTEVLLLLCKLGGFSLATTRAVLLLRAGERGMSQQDIDTALTSFARVNASTARSMLDFHLSRPGGQPKSAAAARAAGRA
jgi:uncharacterized protein (DUF2336 family)